RAPSQKYAAAQIPHSIPCTRANSSPIPPIIQIRIAIRFDTSRPSLSNRTRIFISVKANITTAAAWIAIVNTMSDKPQSQLGWSNIVIRRAPQKSFTAGQTGFPDPGLRLAHSGYDAPLLTIEPPASAAPARQQVEQAALPCLSQRPCHLRFRCPERRPARGLSDIVPRCSFAGLDPELGSQKREQSRGESCRIACSRDWSRSPSTRPRW